MHAYCRRTTVQVTADDIVITNITNNAEGQVEFILFIVLSGGSQVLGVPALESAIQVRIGTGIKD